MKVLPSFFILKITLIDVYVLLIHNFKYGLQTNVQYNFFQL